jgi:hypothetical protein
MRLFVGVYSRVGFNHPGPFYLYVQAAGQALFYRLLHLVPGQYNGQLLGVFVLDAVIVGLISLILYHHLRSLVAAFAGTAVVLAFLGHHVVLASTWTPHLDVLPFLALTLATASIASGDLAMLPIFVFAGGMLIHAHVGFLAIVGVTTVVAVVAGTWFRWGILPEDRPDNRRSLWLSAGVAAVFALPMALDLMTRYPGEWAKYWDYVHDSGTPPHAAGAALRYLLGFWATRWSSGRLLIVGGAALLVLMWRERDRIRRRFLACGLAAIVLESVLFFGFASRGVDDLSQRYLGLFYLGVPLALLVLLVAALVSWVQVLPRGVPRQVALVGGCVLAAVLAIVGAVGPDAANSYRGDLTVPAQVAAVRADPGRAGRPLAMTFAAEAWPDAAALSVAARRAGVTSCVTDRVWALIFTSRHVCTPQEVAAGWPVFVRPTSLTPAPPGRTVWADPIFTITTPH